MIITLYLNIGGTIIMKILRAIGAFFAKIGRWIANTAWIQPLLIVGGIFGMIFSIPYIKQAIENAQVDNTDHDYEYYKSHALDLKENGKAERLFSYLDDTSKLVEVNKEFGQKFFVSFVQKNCADCKECVEGYKQLSAKFHSKEYGLTGSFKLYTILVDKKDDDDNYLAKALINRQKQFFDDLVTTFEDDEYALYKTTSSTIASSLRSMLDRLTDSTLETSEGIDTPITFMYDYQAYKDGGRVNFNGVTAIFSNYIDLMTTKAYGTVKNKVSKGYLLRDCWSYQKIFDPTREDLAE